MSVLRYGDAVLSDKSPRSQPPVDRRPGSGIMDTSCEEKTLLVPVVENMH
jgi:hypothetical protein